MLRRRPRGVQCRAWLTRFATVVVSDASALLHRAPFLRKCLVMPAKAGIPLWATTDAERPSTR